MPIALALAAAAIWGAGDFLGGMATRRLRAEQTLFIAFIHGSPTGADMLWGVVGGLLGNAGLFGLYRELARGNASVVAPTTAVFAALTPVVAGLLLGEHPSRMTMVGVCIALVAVGMLAGGGPPVDDEVGAGSVTLRTKVRRALGSGFWIALVSGLGFGAFYVCLAQTSDGAGLWPLVASRGAAVVVLAMIPSVWRGLRRAPRRPSAMAASAGLLDATANSAYLIAVRAGSLTWVPVLASLYPASTVILSRVVLHQKVGRIHAVGLVLALLAIALVTAGS